MSVTDQCFEMENEFAVDFTIEADGSGLYGVKAGTKIHFTSVYVMLWFGKTNDEDDGGREWTPWTHEVCVEYDTDLGECIPYTDRGVSDGVEKFLLAHREVSRWIDDFDWSEHGAQGLKNIHGDCSPKPMTIAQAYEAGFRANGGGDYSAEELIAEFGEHILEEA